MRTLFSVVPILIIASAAAAQTEGGPPPERVLDALRREHPRLLFTRGRQAEVERLRRADRVLGELIAAELAKASELVEAAPVREELVGPRLLQQSRHAMHVIVTTSLAYRLTGEDRFARRAIDEMRNVASFSSWNPSHFLDVAEMTAGVAIGYDWLYDEMSEAQRLEVRTAIVEKGLRPGLAAYESDVWWSRGRNNWDQVCHGGLTLGALAIAESEPDLAEAILGHAIRCIPRIDHVYEPDGGYPEGPSYWGYGTTYHIMMSNALETALGDRHGVATAAAIRRTGIFPIMCFGPTEQLFNFADGRTTFRGTAALFELARLADDPAIAAWYRSFLHTRRASHRAVYRLSALNVAWFPDLDPAIEPDWPLDMRFDGQQPVAVMRGAWNDPDATWIAVKAGDNRAPHAHMDIGSFVLDAAGVRWAVDLGGDDYGLPGYFGARRWDYFRLNARSHNVVTIAGANQHPEGIATFTRFVSEPDRAVVEIDLTDAYRGQVGSARRTVELIDRARVRITDEFRGAAAPLRWSMATDAAVEIDGAVATLLKDGRRLRLEIAEPAGAAWRVEEPPAPVHERENDNDGVRFLRTDTAAEHIVVTARPVRD